MARRYTKAQLRAIWAKKAGRDKLFSYTSMMMSARQAQQGGATIYPITSKDKEILKAHGQRRKEAWNMLTSEIAKAIRHIDLYKKSRGPNQPEIPNSKKKEKKERIRLKKLIKMQREFRYDKSYIPPIVKQIKRKEKIQKALRDKAHREYGVKFARVEE